MSTSLTNDHGQRAVGTLLDRAHPAYGPLLKARGFAGYAMMFGHHCMTRYEPLLDARGDVIGARVVALDISDLWVLDTSLKVPLVLLAINLLAVAGPLWHWQQGSSVTGAALIWAVLLSCVVAPLVGWRMLCQSVQAPIRTSRAAADRVAGGDLSAQVGVDRRDDIGRLLQSINGIGSGLAQIVGQVRTAGEQMHAAAGEVASGTADLSNRTQSQAASVEQTSATMSQITTTVSQNADNARDAQGQVTDAARLAQESDTLSSQLSGRMQTIRQHASDITSIIATMDSIAFQTNILALNASVEAARAGESGRGFAVVASEVQALAKRSTEAAGEIKQLIEASSAEVENSSELAQTARENAQKVAHQIGDTAALVEGIATASLQQQQGIDEVHQALSQMDEVTQQNAALVEQLETTAAGVGEQAGGLLKAVAAFKTAS